MTAARLRQAATLLRERAKAATPPPWNHNPRKEWFTDPDKLRAARAGVRQTGGEEYVSGNGDVSDAVAATGPSDDPLAMANAAFIATMSPSVAAALAEWLDWYANADEAGHLIGWSPAYVVADAILGAGGE